MKSARIPDQLGPFWADSIYDENYLSRNMASESGKDPAGKVVVYSDYICPFCFIGKSRIDRLKKEFDTRVEWRNIEIHPETPLDGIPRTQLGAGFSQLWLNVERLAKEAGVKIRQPPIISNSSLALIASEYARKEGRFEAFHDRVFRAYWQEGGNIGDINVLLEIGREAGLEPSRLKAYFKEGDWEAALERNNRSASKHQVSGVPTFIIGKEKVVGAQPYEAIKHAFTKTT